MRMTGGLPVGGGWRSLLRESFQGPAGFLASLIVVAQVSWVGVLLNRGWWTQEDYVLLRMATEDSLTLNSLGTPIAGEFSPVGHLLIQCMSAFELLQWDSAMLVVLLLQATASLLLWTSLTGVLGDRWIRLPLLVLGCFAPIVLPSILWFSLALLHLPAIIGFLLAATAFLAEGRNGTVGGRSLVLAGLALALFSSDQTLLLPFALFTTVAIVLFPPGARLDRRVVQTFALSPRFWILAAVLLLVRIMLGRRARAASEAWGDLDSFGPGEPLSTYVKQLIAAVTGGPWDGAVIGTVVVAPDNSATAASALIVLAGLALVLRSGSPATRLATVAVALLLLAGALMPSFLRLPVSVSTHQRYLSVAIIVAVVVLGAGLRTAEWPRTIGTRVRRIPGTVAVAVSLLLVVSCGATLRVLVPEIDNAEDRAYTAALRAGLQAEPRAVLLDGPVPERIMSSVLGHDARISTVARLIPEAPVFDLPSEALRAVDQEGRVRAVPLTDEVEGVPPGEVDCPFPIGNEPTTIPLAGTLAGGRNVVTIGYYTNVETRATLQVGGEHFEIAVADGLHRVQVPFTSAASEITVRIDEQGSLLCGTDVSVAAVEPLVPEVPWTP